MSLKDSKTEQNLKDAFAGESMANRRYLYFAQKADVEGYNDVAAVFRSTAEGETGHAHGHLQFLEEVGDPATGEPIGGTDRNLKAAIVGETHEYTDMYPGMARTAREEGFDEIADWFETLAKAEKSHAGVHIGVLVGLADDRGLEVVGGRADRQARGGIADRFEILEVPVRVAGLALGGRAEHRLHVVVALDVGLLGEIQVATVGLRLTGEGVLEVLLGLAPLQIHALDLLVGRRRSMRAGGLRSEFRLGLKQLLKRKFAAPEVSTASLDRGQAGSGCRPSWIGAGRRDAARAPARPSR